MGKALLVGTVTAVVVIVVIGVVVGVYFALRGKEPLPDLSGKNILLIAAQDFNDTELNTLMQVLGQEAGAQMFIASNTHEQFTGMDGTPAMPDMMLGAVEVQYYEAVVFVGGTGASVFFDNAQAHAIATNADNADKKVCAICIAPVTLANAGVLNGKQATVFDTTYVSILEDAGAIYTGQSVTVDGNIITANGPAAADEFARTIAREIGSS